MTRGKSKIVVLAAQLPGFMLESRRPKQEPYLEPYEVLLWNRDTDFGVSDPKTLGKIMVGVKGFEPSTPTSRT
jgi:hypothetical protein